MNLQEVREFIEILASVHPHAQSELYFTSPFTLLVAVVLSAQATDASVNKVTPTLFELANTPQAMVALGLETLEKLISSIGLWRAKAKHILQLSQQLIDNFNGIVPNNRQDLESLAGVGRKTANVVLNVAFHQNTMAVDTHIFRLSNRTGLAPGKNTLEVEMALVKRIPKHYLRDSHHWLILHGRYTCKARKPECWRCPTRDVCHYNHKQLTV
ncbi:Endonuclease III [Commensalibacter sp. Nvir]|uniref:endonuclease III n=1 Tax=Commensalibacter sp. Nvir TaxID=3069817 RepID=UPI002D5DAE70|nr:Endonuclease III [Commensalibacter sp. Nvir]